MTHPDYGWLVLMLGLGVAAVFALAVWWIGRNARDHPERRWARVAQRRAPVAPRLAGPYQESLDHAARQLELLLTERHHMRLLVEKGEKLRRRMQESARWRDEVGRVEAVRVEAVLADLRRRLRELETLAERYRRHADDLVVLAEKAEFDSQVARVSPGSGDTLAAGAEELDEEMTRLVDIGEAEKELDGLLRA
ncbi:MAG: hypothetical protein HYU66_09860 [Armatimonadetes bacterium]|nr:hypothetical protein [Armatimonadota bacterium]